MTIDEPIPSFCGAMGCVISERRKKLGLTQTQLAQKLGVAQHTMVSKWENGKATPTDKQKELLASLFEIAYGELFGEKSNKTVDFIAAELAEMRKEIVTLHIEMSGMKEALKEENAMVKTATEWAEDEKARADREYERAEKLATQLAVAEAKMRTMSAAADTSTAG